MAKTSAGTKIYIGPATILTDETGLAALSYVEVKGADTLGDVGPSKQDVTFTPLDGSSVQHIGGATDNGSMTISVARDPLDPGQVALRAASETNLEYAVKIVLQDAADENDTDTTYYARGPVIGGRTTIGGANDVTKISFIVGLNVWIEMPSEAVS